MLPAESGFAITSTAPASSASMAMREPACVTELMITTGIGRCFCRMRRNVSPSMRGISTSSVMTSGFNSKIWSRAT